MTSVGSSREFYGEMYVALPSVGLREGEKEEEEEGETEKGSKKPFRNMDAMPSNGMPRRQTKLCCLLV